MILPRPGSILAVMEVPYSRCAGFDVHEDSVVACVRCAGAVPERSTRCGTTERIAPNGR